MSIKSRQSVLMTAFTAVMSAATSITFALLENGTKSYQLVGRYRPSEEFCGNPEKCQECRGQLVFVVDESDVDTTRPGTPLFRFPPAEWVKSVTVGADDKVLVELDKEVREESAEPSQVVPDSRKAVKVSVRVRGS